MHDWVNEVCSVKSFEWSMRAEKCHISTSPTAIFVLVSSFLVLFSFPSSPSCGRWLHPCGVLILWLVVVCVCSVSDDEEK